MRVLVGALAGMMLAIPVVARGREPLLSMVGVCPVPDDVSEADNAINRCRINPQEDSIQGFEVRVDVRNDGEARQIYSLDYEQTIADSASCPR